MKVIFLDIDGVLNNDSTKEEVAGYTFVDEDKIVLLKEILDQTGAKIVLSSTWRQGWECKEHVDEPTPSDMQDIRLFDALVEKLKEYDIELLSYTEDFGTRGAEIDKWLSDWQGEPIERFIILDDMCGGEMRPHSSWLVQTGFRDGLLPKHVQKAIQLLNGEPQGLKELAAEPYNLARKARGLRAAHRELVDIQHRYAPIFDEDEVLPVLQAQVWAEYENVMTQLRQLDEDTKNQITFD